MCVFERITINLHQNTMSFISTTKKYISKFLMIEQSNDHNYIKNANFCGKIYCNY